MKTLYMIGNSHIDPVWFWTWEEGMQEVRATLASALERMEEYPAFRFTCSSTAFLEWVERVDPALFEKIRRRAAEGRFEMVGGWFVEPDCLLPCGEAFVRHALYGQRYLQKKFGRKCHIGFNIDSFGHSAALPQILKKSGMDCYVFMRPRMEESLFRWTAADGSQVQALCLPGEYTTWFHEPLVQNIRTTLDQTPQWDRMTVFYGVGDHGGGPTRENIESVRSLQHAFPDTELRFSTLDEFFRETHPDGQPELTGPFEKINQGCYSVHADYKSLYREAERRLIKADRLMAMVRLAGGEWLPESSQMEELWKLLLFNEFHDTLGGTIIRAARDEAMMQMSAVSARAGILRGIAVQKLVQRIRTGDYGFPLFVVNPGPEEYGGLVETELEWFCQAPLRLMDSAGREIPYQRIHTDTKVRHTVLGGRRRFLFEARVPANGVSVFYVAKQPPKLVWNDDFAIADPATVLDNGLLRATFDPATGGLASLTDRAGGYQPLSGSLRFCLYRDERDCWGGLQGRVYEDEKVTFALDAIEKIESGPLREVIRVRSHYEDTRIETHYSLEKGSDALRVRLLVRFNHPWHLLKMAIPVAGLVQTIAETAYGVHRRRHEDDTEYNMQGFVDGCDREGRGLSVANSGQYGFNVEDGELRLTLTRSAIYAQGNSKDWYNDTETYEYTDLGEHRAELLLRPHGGAAPVHSLYRLSDRLERPWECLLDTVHRNAPDALEQGTALVSVAQDNVRVAVMKKAEDGDGLVLRLLETDGEDTQADISILGRPFRVPVGHYAIESFLYENGSLRPVDLLEETAD